MKSVFTSPFWILSPIFIALTVIVWGVPLLISIHQQKTEIREKTELIARLDALETAVRELEAQFLPHLSLVIPDSLSEGWQQIYQSAREDLNAFARRSISDADLYHYSVHLDSLLTSLYVLYQEGGSLAAGDTTRERVESRFRQRVSLLISEEKEAVTILYMRLGNLSKALTVKWQSLSIIVFLASFLAILLAILLYMYQRDLIRRKRAEKALRQVAAEFRVIFKSIPDAVVFADTNNEIVMVNPAFNRLFGYQPEDVLGQICDILYTSQSAFDLQQKKRFTLQAKEITEPYEVICRRKNGSVFISEMVSNIVKDIGGKPLGFFSIIRDITARKQVENQLREARDKLEQRVKERTVELETANREIKRFAYLVSHDLKAPLVNIKGFTGELHYALHEIESSIKKVLPYFPQEDREKILGAFREEIPEAMQFINSSASRMGVLLDAVLKLSRLGRRELHFENINVRVLIQHVLESLAHQIDKRQVTIKIGALPRVIADRTALEQMLSNILVNAINYLDNQRPGEVEIFGKRKLNETVFHIRDNGRGIAEEDMSKVFELFGRAGHEDVPGEGMGLAYVQTLVRRHGGRIWCESKLGVGTTFSFTLTNYVIGENGHDN